MIRKALKSDIPAIHGISLASFDTPWSLVSFEAEFMKSYSTSYVYEKNGTVIGFLTVWVIQNEAEVVNLAVDKGFRNRGIASALLNYAFTSNANVRKWNLEVAASNKTAYELYEKHGFTCTRIINNYYGEHKNAIQMNREG